MRRALAISVAALAMLTADRAAQAQAVQLPTWEFHGGAFSVLVPDSGAAALGGIRRGAGASARGPLARGIAGGRVASGSNVTAQIHDMAELDERVLGEAAARRGGRPRDFVAKAETESARKSKSLAESTSTAEDAVPSLAEIRRQRAAETARRPAARPLAKR